MKPNRRPSPLKALTISAWRGCTTRLVLVREPWGHFTINETGPAGRRIIVEADTRVVADAAFRQEIARRG
jgi:hypothetical protein